MRWTNFTRREIFHLSTYEDKDTISLTPDILDIANLTWDLKEDDILQEAWYDYNVTFQRIGAAAYAGHDSQSDLDVKYVLFLVDLFDGLCGEELALAIDYYRDTEDFEVIKIDEKDLKMNLTSIF